MVIFAQEIRQSGNSLVITIPINIVRSMGLLEGDWLNIEAELIKPSVKQHKKVV